MIAAADFANLVRGFVWKSDEQIQSELAAHERYYWTKYLIALHAAPSSIVEIGVRCGYSAYSFLLANPNAMFVGYDVYTKEHGGSDLNSGFKQYAEGLLKGFAARIEVVDTQQPGFRVPCADFYHVDGDHSFGGAFHDMESCLQAIRCRARPASLILVDDFAFITDVRRAVLGFVKKYNLHLGFVPSFRGEALLFCGQPPEWVETVRALVMRKEKP